MYRNIPFARFALALGVVAIPLFVMGESAGKWGSRYVVLIILGFAVVNWKPLAQGGKYLSKELGGQ